MEAEMKHIETVSDVGFLLTRLRLAKRRNEDDIMSRIVQRLREIGVLKEDVAGHGKPFENLRAYVDNILKTDGH